MTDITTSASNYCLLNIKKYNDTRKLTKKLIFVDPSVMELKKSREYSQVEQLHYLAHDHLQSNEYLSIDYPCDMNLNYQTEFVQKSIQNNWKYKDNLHYICAIQYDWMAQEDFYFRMKELEPIYDHKKKIVGLGNLCRLLIKRKDMNHSSSEYQYFKKVINYIIANKEKFYWIHIYGMSQYAIKTFVPLLEYAAPKIIFSVDNTKWTSAPNDKIHDKYCKNPNQTQLFPTVHKCTGYKCTKVNRNEFFLESMKELQRCGIKVDY